MCASVCTTLTTNKEAEPLAAAWTSRTHAGEREHLPRRRHRQLVIMSNQRMHFTCQTTHPQNCHHHHRDNLPHRLRVRVSQPSVLSNCHLSCVSPAMYTDRQKNAGTSLDNVTAIRGEHAYLLHPFVARCVPSMTPRYPCGAKYFASSPPRRTAWIDGAMARCMLAIRVFVSNSPRPRACRQAEVFPGPVQLWVTWL